MHPKASSSVRAPVHAVTFVRVPQKVTLHRKYFVSYISQLVIGLNVLSN